MLIANPIYDSVFKYLLEDLDISKGILSALLNENIIELSVKPQESISEASVNSQAFTIYRLDFKAVIQLENGEFKKILIELQKSKRNTDIMRFRRYLAENYQKEDAVTVNNSQITKPLEIVTVYFLGFKLEKILIPILKVSNSFYDVSKQEFLKDKPKEPFVDLLNHESYTIQIPRLPENHQTDLENILSVFNQRFSYDDRQQLDYRGISNTPLTERIINRLNRAIADDNLRMKMNLEDEIDRTFNREFAQMNDELAELTDILIETKEQLDETKERLDETKGKLIDKDKEIEELKKLLEQLKK